jgi:uncharacterized RDD family membrane protein YckC
MAGYSRSPERGDTDVIGARIGAQIIDQILAIVISFGLGMILATTGAAVGGEAAAGLAGIGIFIGLLVLLGYFSLLEGLWDGQTLGKKLLGIKVVKEDGSECDIGASLIRNLLRIIDGMFYYAVGFIFMASSDTRQRIGDRAAGTVVVRVEN